jgi:hypothetical protein
MRRVPTLEGLAECRRGWGLADKEPALRVKGPRPRRRDLRPFLTRLREADRNRLLAALQAEALTLFRGRGSITDMTSDTRSAGKPPCRACSRSISSLGVR